FPRQLRLPTPIGAMLDGLEQGNPRDLAQPSLLDVFGQISLERVVAGHLVELAAWFLTRPRIARASTSERTSGNRQRLGGRTLFLRIATSCGREYGHRETGCRRGGVRMCRAPRHAHRAGAIDSCAPRPRSTEQASANSTLQVRGPPVDLFGRGRKTGSGDV